MSRRLVWWSIALSFLFTIVLGTSAHAGPKRVLVLPFDGNADGTTRSLVNAAVQKLARASADGAVVTVGDATFDETAAAVGCDPASPACAASVRTTLGVDELVYGSVTTDPAKQTTVVIRRSSVTSNPPRSTTIALAAEDSPDRIEQTLGPAFGVTAPNPEPIAPIPAPTPVPAGPRPDHTRRNIGIACVAGGGLGLAIGLALWGSESSKQDAIDRAPTKTVADLRRLQDLEDKAQTYAILGDVMIVAGLALGGVGGWILYKNHKTQESVVLTPVVTPTGPAVLLGGAW
ncbi:MAG: hypothetical protein IPQ07_17715 [Myxococcales bacterium]|nr:hypothetical protein [Myxococcales bacterium]